MLHRLLNTCPNRLPTTHVEVVDDELCVYEWTTQTVHALNRTAARVWQLCDGRTTIAQMSVILQSELDEPHAADVVRHALRVLGTAGLLEADAALDRRAFSRRELVRTLGLTAAIPVVTSIVAPSRLAAQSGGNSRTFDWTGSAQSFTVPAGIASIQADVIGASGAGFLPTSVPGFRGRVQATLAVIPGEVLTIMVGGLGGLGGAGGFNGGGDAFFRSVYGGGGASDIRRGSTKLIVAGGGGGAGFGGGHGGDGGDLIGAIGIGFCGYGGAGGSQTAGGVGGAGGPGGQSGSAGSLGLGGSASPPGPCGGGGGGGYYGGGSGGGCGVPFGATGGGGGGSSYGANGVATNVVHTQGYATGNGQITVSW
jgi:hypothetical protein